MEEFWDSEAMILFQYVASALALSVVGNITRNVFQTYSLPRKDKSSTEIPQFSNIEEGVKFLESLSRKELLQIFLQSRQPSNLSEVEGEWNGHLLDNGPVLTPITSFISNQLFGIKNGRKWNGKVFGNSGVGINRFLAGQTTRKEHKFDYSIQSSKVDPKGNAVRLIYSKYQPLYSPWNTMSDEVRLLPGSVDILIGMGCMGWSGGFLNAAPFCLSRAESKKDG
jgi:hypothetical protein